MNDEESFDDEKNDNTNKNDDNASDYIAVNKGSCYYAISDDKEYDNDKDQSEISTNEYYDSDIDDINQSDDVEDDEDVDYNNYDVDQDNNKTKKIFNYAQIFEQYSGDDILEFVEQHPFVVRQINREGDYPLHIAIRLYHDDINSDIVIMNLTELSKTLAVIKPNRAGYYPLHIACDYCQSENVIMKLIEVYPEAAKISLDYGCESFPLHIACLLIKSETVIKTLIELNPSALQCQNIFGEYPIHCAIDGDQSNEIIQHILNVDPVSIQRQNAYGESPLHMDYPDRLDNILMESMVHHLDININMRDNKGMTALYHACNRGKDDVIKLLLQYPGIDVNAKCSDDNATPLHCALFNPDTNILQMLLDHPFIVIKETNSKNETPLDVINQQIFQFIENQTTDDNDDANLFHDPKEMLTKSLEVKKLLEDFPIKRRWQAFLYLLGNIGEAHSAVIHDEK